MNVLITSGRTISQGNELYYKDGENYSVETGRCFVNPFDLLELDAVAGDSLLLSTETGEEVFIATPCEDVASGTIFIPCGPHANAILHATTRGTGAPDYKWIEGSARRVDTPPRSGWEILVEEGGAVLPLPEVHGHEETGNSVTVRDCRLPALRLSL